MSGRSFASGSVRSCAGSVRLGAPGAGGGGHELVLDALYERKRDNKSVRVLTVIIYVFCVSLAAIMLSLYYVFFWDPKDAPYAQRKVAHTVDQPTSTTPMPTCLLPHDTGGSNNTVSNNTTVPPPENDTSGSPEPTSPIVTKLKPSTTQAPYKTTETIDNSFDNGTDVISNGTNVTPNGTNVTPNETNVT